MPFTLSHTIAIYIFKPWLKKLSITGLILGCMAPDFEYFLRMRMQGDIGHHLLGIFLLDIPIALIIALFFHSIIKNKLIENLPFCLKQRFILYKDDNWLHYFKQHYLIVISSILLGILTHLIWDSFTHQSGWCVRNVEFLSYSIAFMQFKIPLYKIFQHFSSMFGLFILCLFIYKMPKYLIEDTHIKKYWFWIVWFSIFILFIILWGLFNWNLIANPVHMVVAIIACLFLSGFINCLIFKFIGN
jgi:hypothetical protein